MSFGGQSVTIRSFTDSETRNRLNQPVQTVTDTAWTGVQMQPRSGGEDVTLTDVATEVWLCTGPPIAAAQSATATAEIIYNTVTYRVTKVEPFTDFTGIHHVEITCQKQTS